VDIYIYIRLPSIYDCPNINSKNMIKNLLEIDSVILEFGSRRILQDVYLKSETGKITGLLGRNGTGKSCIFKILFGELISSSQSVRINGNSLIASRRPPQKIRYLPQNSFIPTSLTLKRVLCDFELDFLDMINHFPEFKKHYKSKLINLSSGQRRIIEIFVIVRSQTEFCILDEPFSQVMPLHIETIKKIIEREKTKKGIIITDHMYKHIIELSDDLYVINNGKVYLTKSDRDIETLGYARITNRS
jgi:ABC-type lipopolysaccharide export system ATPase subunit